MSQKILIGLGAVVTAALFALLFVLPGMLESDFNKTDGQPMPALTEAAREFHQTLTVVDLHADTLLWKRDLTQASDRGHVDLPRLKQGNVALQIFSSVTKTPKGQNYDSNSADGDNITLLAMAQLQPVRTWFSLLERSLYHAEKLKAAVASAGGNLALAQSASELSALADQRSKGGGVIGTLLSIEGLHNLEGRRENLDRLYDAGFRMAGLLHFFDNELGGSMHGEQKGGLTDFGREVVVAMEDKGMIVDIAHLSHSGVAEVLAMARRPVVSSHGGVQATCDVNRNLTDEEIRGVAKTGGLIGIGYWAGAVCDTTPAATARAMKHVRDLVGVQHIALGSDYDGAVEVRFDTSQLAHITQALMVAGFDRDEIRAVMGGNAMRVLAQGIEPL